MKRGKKVLNLSSTLEAILEDSADVYLMFVDLCDSTDFKKQYISNKLPDNDWVCRQIIFLQKSADYIKRYNGVIAKTMGDAVLAYFDATSSPSGILKCGIEIIQGFDNLKSYKGTSKINSKISFDFGLTYNGAIDGNRYDPIGTPVDRCSRLNSVATQNQILVSSEFYKVLNSEKLGDNLQKQYGFTSQKRDLKGLGITTFYAFLAQ